MAPVYGLHCSHVQIMLQHVGQDFSPFIDAFGSRVLPQLAA